MATHLNLEEQEQIAQLKGFWAEYGRAIIMVAVLLVAIIGGWAGWEYLQNRKAQGATVLYDQLNQAVGKSDLTQIKQVTTQIQTEYASTAYASIASLEAATFFYNRKDLDSAQGMLAWVKDHSKNEGWKALAVVRLADVFIDQKKYTEALSVLATEVPPSFASLVADKRGNIFIAQGNTDEAKKAFLEAFQKADVQSEFKWFVGAKLGLLGVDVLTTVPAGEQQV